MGQQGLPLSSLASQRTGWFDGLMLAWREVEQSPPRAPTERPDLGRPDPRHRLPTGRAPLSPASVLHLQRMAGNRSVAGLFACPPAAVVQRCGDHPCDCPGHQPVVAQRQEEPEAPTFKVGQVLDVPPIVVDGSPAEEEGAGGCENLQLHGSTTASFDGGPGAVVVNQKAKVSKSCKPPCDDGTPCVNVTGTLQSTYSASVTITMPSMPSGLTECEQGHVQKFLDKVLKPHEEDHKSRLKSYDGKTKIPINVTACGMDEATKKVEKIHLDEDANRQEAARKQSDKIDPFNKTVDCSDCYKES